MKLKPSKFTFGAEEGHFLGYYIARDIIQSNLRKCKDLLETNKIAT